MRRTMVLVILAGVSATAPAAAQGFGWMFGEPPPHRRPRWHRVEPAPPDVPLPPPRPHFPGDDPVQASKPTTPTKPEETKPKPGETNPFVAAPPATKSAPSEAPPAKADDKPITPPLTPAPANGPKLAPVEPPSAESTTPPLPPVKPPDLGNPPPAPSPAPPAVAPSGASTAFNPREPVADPQCADHLKARGVVAEPTSIGPQPDARCTVVQPMRLLSETLADGSTVTFPDKPTIACITADAFSAYVHDLVAPLAKGTWGVGVTAVSTGPGLECRSRDHVFGAKLSAHGQGLAVDIAQLKLADGRVVAVGDPKTDAERGFETAARAGGCGYFHTVLGPGSDSYHRTHWHFDLEVRGREGDSKYCK